MAFERIDSIFDSGTNVELDSFVLHECNEFGLENKKIESLTSLIVNEKKI